MIKTYFYVKYELSYKFYKYWTIFININADKFIIFLKK